MGDMKSTRIGKYPYRFLNNPLRRSCPNSPEYHHTRKMRLSM